jgi:DeoR/GlpR family transcriptional regulator of sugar metabolism
MGSSITKVESKKNKVLNILSELENEGLKLTFKNISKKLNVSEITIKRNSKFFKEIVEEYQLNKKVSFFS